MSTLFGLNINLIGAFLVLGKKQQITKPTMPPRISTLSALGEHCSPLFKFAQNLMKL